MGLATLNLDDSQQQDESFTTTDLIIETLYQSISLALDDSNACTQTLGGSGTSITNGKTINSIAKGSGGTLISVGDKDSRKLVEIDSMKLKDLSRVSGQSYGEINLAVTFKKLSKVLKKGSGGERKITYDIPLRISFSSGNRLSGCFMPASESAHLLVCQQLAGTWDAATKKCSLPYYGKNCLTTTQAQNNCQRALGSFDALGNLSCIKSGIEADGTATCPWNCNKTCPTHYTLDWGLCSCECSRSCAQNETLDTSSCTCRQNACSNSCSPGFTQGAYPGCACTCTKTCSTGQTLDL